VGTGYFSVLQPAGVHLVHVNADHFKAAVHDGFWAAHGAPGSLTVWHGEKNDRELAKFARMIVAEQRVLKTVGEKEPKVVWAVQNRTNHYLDTAAYARCAAEIEGIRLAAPRLPGKLTTKSSHAEPGQPLKWSRDKY
jgi:phage terminase large subunit GpA-like protein